MIIDISLVVSGIVREAKILNNLLNHRKHSALFKQPSSLKRQSCLKGQALGIYSKSHLFILNIFLCLVLMLCQNAIAQNSIAQNSGTGNLNLHTVLANETLFAIAQRYGSTVEEIVDRNQLVGQTIYVGQRLYISNNLTNMISAQAPQVDTSQDGQSSDSPLTVERQGFYITIVPGESLLGIALRYGVPIGELANVNNIEDVTNIAAGSSLYIPAPQNSLPVAQVVPINAPVAEQLQTVAQGSGMQGSGVQGTGMQDSGVRNIQIVASRHMIGGGSSSAQPQSQTAYPSGPQVRIGVAAPISTPIPAPTYPTGAQVAQPESVPVSQVGQATRIGSGPVQVVETAVQPVGGFVPQDQSPKQQLLQQQMVLLRQSGPQLAIFQPPLQEFAWPLAIKGRISSNYGSRKLAITSNRFHYGLDLAAATGTAVKAAKSGTVKEASWIGGYGNAVYIDHPDGTQTRYAHMSKLNVSEGDTVAQGDVIGKVGSTGVSTGPHLHFEIRVKGYAVDPLEYISQP